MRALVEGVNYTRSGADFTFGPADAGREVLITCQVGTGASWQDALGQLGLSLAPGLVGQGPWSWQQSYAPDQALAYSGMAYVYADSYQLTNQAEVENHSFEVVTGMQVGDGVVDAWPHEIVRDFLGNPYYGVGWLASRLGALQAFTDYCKARQLWLSPVMEEQRPAREWLQAFADITNSEWAWQGTVLDLIPRGDEEITSTYGTYTPDTAPVFDLVHAEGGDILGPVEVEPIVNEDAKNIIRVQWTNRANGYAVEIMEARDAAHIEVYGERPADVVNMEAIHDAGVAQSVAQQLLQRQMTVWNRYKFRTPFSRALLGLMSLVTLTDDDSALDRVPVRITGRSEMGKLEYEFEAEDAPIGAASAPIYGQQAGAGFAHDYNAPAPAVLPPVIFEAPVERATATGLEVYAAVTGPAGSVWGGCKVWASFDGINYKQVGRLYGGARYGAVATGINDSATSVSVQLAGQGGQILPGSAADAAQLETLCWLAGAADGGEYVTHEGATLTGANAYTLSGLHRGVLDTTKQAHGTAAAFVRVDNALAKSGPLDLSLIGTTMYFKFTSVNVYGGGEQELSEVTAYEYTITGAMAKLPPANFDYFHLDVQPDGTRQFTFGYVSTARPPDLLGAQIRYIEGSVGSPAWDSMRRFDDLPDNGYYSQSPVETNMLLAGTYTFALRALDRTLNVSRTPMLITATLPDRRKGNTLAEFEEFSEGWPGIKTSCHVVGITGHLEADDTTTWSSLGTWSSFTRWSMSPASPIVYTSPVRDLGTTVPAQLDSTADASGTVVLEMRTSLDNVTWSSWGSAAAPFTARYVQVRLTVTATGGDPVPTIRSWRYSVSADLKRETIENLSIATLTGSYRIGVGDVRIPLRGTYSVVKAPSVVIQDSSAGTWSWVLIDKNVSPGPRVQFRKNGTLTDPASVDFEVEGI